jgi:hypothetical protein
VTQEDPTKALWYVIALLIGGAIGWISKMFRDRHEIKKLKSDVLKNRIDLIEKISSREDVFNAVCGEITKEYELIVDYYRRSQFDKLGVSRNLLCRLICEKYLVQFKYVCELTIQRWSLDHARQLSYVKSEMIPQLEKAFTWIITLNDQSLLDKIGQTPLKISPSTMQRYIDVAMEVGKSDREPAVAKVNELIRKICLVQNKNTQ